MVAQSTRYFLSPALTVRESFPRDSLNWMSRRLEIRFLILQRGHARQDEIQPQELHPSIHVPSPSSLPPLPALYTGDAALSRFCLRSNSGARLGRGDAHPRCPAPEPVPTHQELPDWLPPHSPAVAPSTATPPGSLTPSKSQTSPWASCSPPGLDADIGPAGLWASQELASAWVLECSLATPYTCPPIFHDLLTVKPSWILPDKNSREKPLTFPDRQFFPAICSLLLFSEEKGGILTQNICSKCFSHTHTSACLNHQFGKFRDPVFGGKFQ